MWLLFCLVAAFFSSDEQYSVGSRISMLRCKSRAVDARAPYSDALLKVLCMFKDFLVLWPLLARAAVLFAIRFLWHTTFAKSLFVLYLVLFDYLEKNSYYMFVTRKNFETVVFTLLFFLLIRSAHDLRNGFVRDLLLLKERAAREQATARLL